MNIKEMGYVLICAFFLMACSQTVKKTDIEEISEVLKIENPKNGFISKLLPTKWEESLISGNGNWFSLNL